MNELKVGDLERNLAENDSYKKEERTANDTVSNLTKK